MAVVATVMTAGIMGALAGVSATSGGLFATGLGVLGGSLMPSIGTTLAAGFSAGFIGNIASQGVAKGLELQEDISLKGALITGLATAATAGLLRGLNGAEVYKDWVHQMDNLSVSKTFSISSAAQLMEQNALSQSISLALQKHQHFDWEQLAVSGITAGLMGGTLGTKLDKTLRGLDHNTGMLTSELRALTNAGLDSAVAGSQFNAVDVLHDNLGGAIGSAITEKDHDLEQVQTTEKKEQLKQTQEVPFVLQSEQYLTDTVLDMIRPERTEKAVYQNYLAQKLSGSEGYESTQAHLTEQQTRHLGNYERLSFDSELFKSGDEMNNSNFESKVYWNSKEHGVMQFIEKKLSPIGVSEINYEDLAKSEDFKIYLSTIYGEAGGQSQASWIAIGNVINNRVGYREWSRYKTQSDVIKNTGFDAYWKKTNQYEYAYNLLSSGNLNSKMTEMMHVVAPVYLGLVKDTTHGAVLYYSPKAQKILSSRSKEYKSVPNWRWDELKRVYPSGVGKDDFAFYKYKKN